MSLYNMLFGTNPDADSLLSLLESSREEFGRFRDVYVENGFIVVHTRCGGGNREDYFPEWVEDHPWYSHDQDCDFDCTYADIYFKVPSETIDQLRVAFSNQGTNPNEAWPRVLEQLSAGSFTGKV
jgi:hypothetical protein